MLKSSQSNASSSKRVAVVDVRDDDFAVSMKARQGNYWGRAHDLSGRKYRFCDQRTERNVL